MFQVRLKREKKKQKKTHKSWPSWDIHLYGVVNDEIGGTDGVNLHWVSAKSLDCFTHGSKVHNHRHATGDTNNRFPQPQAQHWWYKQQISTTTGTPLWHKQISTTTGTLLAIQITNNRFPQPQAQHRQYKQQISTTTGNTNNRFSQPQAPHWQYKTNNRFPQPQAHHQQQKQTTGSTTKHRQTTGIVAIQHSHRDRHSSPAMQTRTDFHFFFKTGKPPAMQTSNRFAQLQLQKMLFPQQNTGTALVTHTDFHNPRQMIGNAINRLYIYIYIHTYKQQISTTGTALTIQTDFHNHRHTIGNKNNRSPQPQTHYWQHEQ